MITVMKEKDDFTANLFLETSGRRNLSEQKSLRKKSARLVAETNNRMAHRSERPSSCSVSFRAAKDSLLQDRRHDQHSRASDQIEPEVPYIRCSEQDAHQRLRKERPEKHGRSGNAADK